MPFEKMVRDLAQASIGERAAAHWLNDVEVTALESFAATGDSVSRAALSAALGLCLFGDLVDRVPEAQRYVRSQRALGRKVVFDHGALRTVAWNCGALPRGEAAVTRFLLPLGYRLAGVYPLPKLKMTGRAYLHQDAPQWLPQYFVSELHPEQFSLSFQATTSRVLASSADPLTVNDLSLLETLRRDERLQYGDALVLLSSLLGCFARQHGLFAWTDYQSLFTESKEMAWISTEGNAFNHATDRVQDVAALATTLRQERYAIKDSVEVSANGRVRQTALLAPLVTRQFLTPSGTVQQQVPGSFYEFITRDVIPETADTSPAIDLTFDSSNATGIFKMTSRE
jgi:Domain of unknown function (DUF1338)